MNEKIQIEYIHLSEIIPYSKNPRKNEKAIEIVAKSIREFGFKNPIILDKKNEIVAGHTRLKAAIKLKLTEVPIIRAENLTEEQVKAFRIMDNKSIEYASWDVDLLKTELEELKKVDFDLDLTGFSERELDKLLEEEKESFDLFEKEPKYKIKQGELWQLGNHKLMCGDATNKEEIKKLIGNEIIDLVLTDPPYNLDYKYNSYEDNKPELEYLDWCKKWFENIKEIGEKVLITPGPQNIWMWCQIERPRWILSWFKRNSQTGCAIRGLNRQEPIFFYSKYEPIIFYGKLNKIIPEDSYYDLNEKSKLDVYDVKTAFHEDANDGMREQHTCPKPVRLFCKIIQDWTRPQNTILDVFAGSGTTIIACERTNRKAFGLEIDPVYCSVIIERWENYTGKNAKKLN